MTNKIFRSTLLVAVLVLLCVAGIVMGVLSEYFDGVVREQLSDELRLAATGTQLQGSEYLRQLDDGQFRLTWVDRDGTVLYDTQADETAMNSHADREEILEALQTGSGSSVRYSDTPTEKTLYQAMRLSDGTVLRISTGSATTGSLLLGMLPSICVVVILAIALCAVLSQYMARRIVKPINCLDLEQPLSNRVYDEISPLLQRINEQNLQIASQMRKLQRKNDEFTQIIASMHEGLVLLDKDGLVISINSAAKRLFNAQDDWVGRDFLTMETDPEVRNEVNCAYLSGFGKLKTLRNGRHYRFSISRIDSGGSTVGVVLLTFDITEQVMAEQNRREFTANVSHELKTPLQSIMGSAELLENGLVQQADRPAFIGRIRKEAGRLLSLIEDILRLSQLDEGVVAPKERVELLDVCHNVAETLQSKAEQNQIKLRVTGEAVSITAVRRQVYEIVYNLCDNAVKYNIPGGEVELALSEEKNGVRLQVKDTGIGIPEEHRSRIFERFYRVDKSHSRQSGGTGLGLSIVKHAAQYHNAKISVESEPGQGTTVTVIFP